MISTVVITAILMAYALKVVIKSIKNTKKALEGKGCSGCQYKKSPIVQINFK